MKLIGILACLTIAVNACGQSIARNETDEFTGGKIVETEWELLTRDQGVNYFYRIRVVDNHPVLELNVKVSFADEWTISRGDPLVLKLDNDTIVKLISMESSVSSHGSGHMGLLGYRSAQTVSRYQLSNKDINAIIERELVMFRIATSQGFIEEIIRKKHLTRLSNTLKLLWPKGIK